MLTPRKLLPRCALTAVLFYGSGCFASEEERTMDAGRDEDASVAPLDAGTARVDAGDAGYGDPGERDAGYRDAGYRDAGHDAGYEDCDDDYPAPTPPSADALLWSSHGGSPLWDFCRCKPDQTVLPEDPRSLVQPGISDGRAVAFNAFWKNCHVDPVAVGERGPATTCGELRERVRRGAVLMTPSAVGGGALFSGTKPTSLASGFGIATFPASAYNDLWRVWGGFLVRPSNFDELVSERYGAPFGNTHNPYPLPGEDPNRTNGGSGRLPYFFTQLREEDGTWSGKIGITCHGCHSGAAGTAADGAGLGLLEGSGSPLADHDLFLRDMLPLGYPASVTTLLNLNRTRGVNNASDINLAFFFPEDEWYDLPTLLGLITSGSTAGMDTPAWWNMGHRPVKFIDGVFPMDAPRVDMVFYTPFAGLFGAALGPIGQEGQDWMREHGPDANDWVAMLKAPAYPYPVDRALAEEGAVLFHTLDLWAPGRGNTVRDPNAGNGSCASCHGAYAPRYTNDPAFLATPALEGVASYITPIDVIGTDRVRLDTNNQAVQRAGALSFFGYPQTAGTDQDCGPQNRDDLRGDRELGYLAQPLYGVWATAPYFHNGSVPNLWEVLSPEDRPRIWRRYSTPARWDQVGRVVMGFDTNLGRAFDRVNVGWYYDDIACETQDWWEPEVTPYIDCIPGNDMDPLVQRLLSVLYSNVILAWNLLDPPTLTRKQMEERKIYNTHMYGQGNGGHAFTSVLTDHERLAIIEYLKTL